MGKKIEILKRSDEGANQSKESVLDKLSRKFGQFTNNLVKQESLSSTSLKTANSNPPRITIKSQDETENEGRLDLDVRGAEAKIIDLEGEKRIFYHQPDGYNCGPCLCLNIKSFLRVDNECYDPRHIRKWLEEKMDKSGEYTGENAGKWLSLVEVLFYLTNKYGLNLELETVSGEPERPELRKQKVEQLFSEKEQDFFLWGPSRHHFRGYFYSNETGRFYSVNSQDEGVSEVTNTKTDFWYNDFLKNAEAIYCVSNPDT